MGLFFQVLGTMMWKENDYGLAEELILVQTILGVYRGIPLMDLKIINSNMVFLENGW